MLMCRPPRDLNFRILVDGLNVNERTTVDWKADLTKKWHQSGWREQKQTVEAPVTAPWSKKRDRDNADDKWQGSSSSSTGWSGTWAAAATWGSQTWGARGDSSADDECVKQAATSWTTDGNIVIPATILFLLITFFMIFIAYRTIKFVTETKFYIKIKKIMNVILTDDADGDIAQFCYCFRSVGTHSQATHDGQRFKAYENGFRRAGEVTYEIHEFWPVQKKKHVD